jgi:hypothetical protein
MSDCECNGICEKCGYANRKDAMDSLERVIVISYANATVNAFLINYCLRTLLNGDG